MRMSALMLMLTLTLPAWSMTSEFTYQGFVSDGTGAIDGSVDLQVACYDAAAAGTRLGAINDLSGVTVVKGVFTVLLDFGSAAFPGTDRWLDISVRRAPATAFTTLAPRQRVTPMPYALLSANADSATVSAQLLGFPLAAGTPAIGQLLRFNGLAWEAHTPPPKVAFRTSFISTILPIHPLIVVPFDGESFDVHGDYEPTTRTFTAPVAGVYRFDLRVRSLGGSAGNFINLFLASGALGSPTVHAFDTEAVPNASSQLSALIQLPAGGQIYPVVSSTLTGGGSVLDGDASYFSGELVAAAAP